MLGKMFKAKLFYGSKGKSYIQLCKGLSMEIESYYNKCLSSNILEHQDKFPPNKSVYPFIWFICPSDTDSIKRENLAM